MGLISRKLLHSRPQELGKIKIGGVGAERKKQGSDSTFRLPTKFKHFIVTTRVRGDDGNFLKDAVIHGKIGAEPTELAGILMFDRPDENFHSEMVVYEGKGKKGKVSACDGEHVTNLKSGEIRDCSLLGGGQCKCKPYSRFHIQLVDSPHTLGFHLFRSQGWETANNIQTALEDIFARFGTCYHAPVKLVCYPSEDVHDAGTSTSLKVGLVLAMPMLEAAQRMIAAEKLISRSRNEIRLLASGVKEDLAQADEDEADEVAAIVDAEIILPPSGPQAVSTAGGEPKSAPPAGAKPLPVEGAAPATPKAPQAPRATPKPAEFDRDDARKRLMATLSDFGIKNDPARKAWCVEHQFPASTKDWTLADFGRAQTLLTAPTIESVQKALKGDESALEDLSLRVLGIKAPEYLRHWKALLATIEAGEDGEENEL